MKYTQFTGGQVLEIRNAFADKITSIYRQASSMDELWRRDAKADAFRRALCSRIETEEGDALYILLSQVQNRIWKEQKARVKNAEAEASAIEIMDFIKNF